MVLNSVVLRRLGGERFQRRTKPRLLPRKQLCVVVEIKDRGHEVLGASVLIQPADQIPNGRIKFFRVHDGGVENQLADCLADRISLIGCHTDQHFEVDTFQRPSAFRHQVSEGNVKKVVASDPDADSLRSCRGEGVFQHPLVVGVTFLL